MSRMLKALQSLEDRTHAAAAPAPSALQPESLATVEHLLGAIGNELVGDGGWSVSTAFPTLQVWQTPTAVEVVETPLYRPPAGPSEATADRPALEPCQLEITSQYRDLAADLAETWDLPAAIILAGATAGRGHEVVGLSLAAALRALLNERVLVVDGDFRDPAAASDDHDMAAPRLADALSTRFDCRKLAAPTIYPGVDVLSAFWDERHDGPLVERADFLRLIRSCKQAYRVVLVTAPPLDYPETPVLAAACDGAYLVVRLGHATSRSLLRATTSLQSRGGVVWGCLPLADG